MLCADTEAAWAATESSSSHTGRGSISARSTSMAYLAPPRRTGNMVENHPTMTPTIARRSRLGSLTKAIDNPHLICVMVKSYPGCDPRRTHTS
jgi:hypothetical protein